jgi:transglutaminase-like putative cysteine protease
MTEPRRLRVRHVTTYAYDAPQSWGLLRLRLTPKAHRLQRILSWDVTLDGARRELSYDDHHRNAVDLASLDPGTTSVTVRCEGEVEVTDAAGVLGPHGGFAPLWLFLRETPRTRPGPACAAIVERVRAEAADTLPRLHTLTGALADAIAFSPGATDVASTAEEAVAHGRGVCQDHAHAFLACARALGVPARYVSGYLLMDRTEQEASHAWAEAWVEGLGWVGFDATNRICPDDRYIRVATGLDYGEASPVSGARRGAGGESLSVHVEVASQ